MDIGELQWKRLIVWQIYDAIAILYKKMSGFFKAGHHAFYRFGIIQTNISTIVV